MAEKWGDIVTIVSQQFLFHFHLVGKSFCNAKQAASIEILE
jgi:hypothetical protein